MTVGPVLRDGRALRLHASAFMVTGVVLCDGIQTVGQAVAARESRLLLSHQMMEASALCSSPGMAGRSVII